MLPCKLLLTTLPDCFSYIATSGFFKVSLFIALKLLHSVSQNSLLTSLMTSLLVCFKSSTLKIIHELQRCWFKPTRWRCFRKSQLTSLHHIEQFSYFLNALLKKLVGRKLAMIWQCVSNDSVCKWLVLLADRIALKACQVSLRFVSIANRCVVLCFVQCLNCNLNRSAHYAQSMTRRLRFDRFAYGTFLCV